MTVGHNLPLTCMEGYLWNVLGEEGELGWSSYKWHVILLSNWEVNVPFPDFSLPSYIDQKESNYSAFSSHSFFLQEEKKI